MMQQPLAATAARTPAPAPHPVASGDAYLSMQGVTKFYGGARAVDDLWLDVPQGSLLGLLGPSGCGKTTALRMIAGLLPVSDGTIRVDDIDITHLPPHRRDIGLVFQNYALFPHMTVAENVAFGLDMRKVARAEARTRVEEALEMVRLPGYGPRKPRDMSGGQQQRVALARALVIRPRILLLDEPLSNLDAKLRDDMRVEIREIQQRLNITTVFVTHDQVEALTMCDVVGVMSAGRLQQLGSPEDIYERPASRFVAEFVGRINTLEGELVAPGQLLLAGRRFGCASEGMSHGAVKAAIRPHRIALTPYRDRALLSTATNSAAGWVRRITYIGDLVQYEVDAGGFMLKVEMQTATAGPLHQVGDQVMCEWQPTDMLVFAE